MADEVEAEVRTFDAERTEFVAGLREPERASCRRSLRRLEARATLAPIGASLVTPDADTERPLDRRAIEALERHPAVQRVQLVGSRAAGTATESSDWDFAVETDDFRAIARDIGSVLATLQPSAQQWDRLSETQCWMVILPGPGQARFHLQRAARRGTALASGSEQSRSDRLPLLGLGVVAVVEAVEGPKGARDARSCARCSTTSSSRWASRSRRRPWIPRSASYLVARDRLERAVRRHGPARPRTRGPSGAATAHGESAAG